MGHHHWKQVISKNTDRTGFSRTTIGLFTRCVPSVDRKSELCFPNMYPAINSGCLGTNIINRYDCLPRTLNATCGCDFLPSTKGIAACAIIAAVLLGIAIILLFIHSIKTTETRTIGLCLSFLPLLLLLLAFLFILTALILVGCYLSRDIMQLIRTNPTTSWGDLRQQAKDVADIRIGWASGLEIIALVFTFFSFILYSIFVFKLGRTE
ncbi:unnamed protein product [Adineta steineri]|uniref:Uncharacterized protein n=1 Tax=Adineta steineri TaxID=433720 RepID=A0A818L3E2_9BILA|nr:unnamed protein product [Adineta steineri]CAF1380939.1 unnamed protein product [Adineta steineri]CAF3563608.1 unnamed protein product [Adineta steineri]CAF3717559.1 unnamed protein product [Adineta steineri]